MVKLIGSNKIKTAVFISGTGSNLKNLIQLVLQLDQKKEFVAHLGEYLY